MTAQNAEIEAAEIENSDTSNLSDELLNRIQGTNKPVALLLQERAKDRQRIADLEAENERLNEENDRLGRELADERKRTAELEERVDAIEAESQQADESDDSSDESGSSTPMHQLIEAGEAGVLGHVTASVRRAKAIAEHFGQWAKRAPKGLVVGDDVKRLLETATGERLEWSQINRARRTLAEMSKGAIAAKKRKGDWILVAQPDDHRYQSLSSRGG